ncbi:MAG: tetratricopeptide repeat protein [Massilia sp.]
MLFPRWCSALVCAALLAACASTPPPAPPRPTPTLASMLEGAEQAVKAGNNEQALALLKVVTTTFPSEIAPRLRIAQLQFDCHNYGEAIFHAQEVLDRDPDDLMALSIAAVSGLRVASRALSELAQKNNLTGSVRAEATDLARMLRANIGGDILPPVKAKPAKTAVVKPLASTTPSMPKAAAGDSPANWLNN